MIERQSSSLFSVIYILKPRGVNSFRLRSEYPMRACYLADLLLREYRQVRNKMTKRTFSYRRISNVYTIVLFEKSTSEFHEFPNKYIHKFRQMSDTGLKINLLQEYVFVPLDIFKENHQNEVFKRNTSIYEFHI